MDLKNQAAINLFTRLETEGIPYFCDTQSQKLLKLLKPRNINGLIDVYQLSRSCIPETTLRQYLRNKKSPDKIEFIHPLLEGHLQQTFGVLLYQEQLVEIIQHLAGFGHEKANEMRIALGKKHQKNLDVLFSYFDQGALRNSMFVYGCGLVSKTPTAVLEKLREYFEENIEFLIQYQSCAYPVLHAYQIAYNRTHE
jgi:DNA polymerase-3 subunit alpha